MVRLLPELDITRLIIYVAFVLVLILYLFFAKYREHKLKIPVGLFIFYFALMAAITVVKIFYVPYAIELMELVATMFLVIGIIRLITFVFVDYLMMYKGLAPIPVISRDIGLTVVYIVTILIILRFQANVNLASLITTSAVLTVVIGLALQDTLGNLFSGIVLQMEKPYHIGDWVRFDQYTGKVIGMTWKSTRIFTREKEEICIPNNLIAKSHILNYSQPDPIHVAKFQVGTSYADPPNNVREAILGTIAEHPSVIKTPSPEVRVIKYNDFSVDYEVRFLISDFENEEKIKSHLLNQLWYRFKRDGITIPFPIRTVHQVRPDPERERKEKDSAKDLALSRIRAVDIFSPLTDEDFRKLASRVHFERFSGGEMVIREGAPGKSMYIIVSGECDVSISTAAGQEHMVATLRPGQFFGEMSLLTGEPRSATVRAKTDLFCIRIEKEDLQDIIEAHSAVANSMSDILAVRKEETDAKKAELKEVHGKKSGETLATQILSKIKAFFDLKL